LKKQKGDEKSDDNMDVIDKSHKGDEVEEKMTERKIQIPHNSPSGERQCPQSSCTRD